MIMPGTSTSPMAPPDAMRAGTPTRNPRTRLEAASRAIEAQQPADGTRYQGSAFHHGILRRRRITNVIHQPGEVDPSAPVRPQSP